MHNSEKTFDELYQDQNFFNSDNCKSLLNNSNDLITIKESKLRKVKKIFR